MQRQGPALPESGVQQIGDVAHLRHAVNKDVHALRCSLSQPFVHFRLGTLQHFEMEFYSGEVLANTVVQFAADLFPLLVL